MPKKKKSQFDNYKKYTTDEGYTFVARDEEDARLYVEKVGGNLGKLKEVVKWKSCVWLVMMKQLTTDTIILITE